MSYGYDTLNRRITSTDSRTGMSTTNYKSNTCDLVACVSDPGSRTTAFTYDIRGRRLKTYLPGYDDALGDADPANAPYITETSYFSDNTVNEVSGGQTYRRTYTYDYAQRQKTLTTYGTTTATTEWVYSTTRGFLTEKNYHGESGNGPGNTADYTYTAAGRLATRTWERGVTTTYHYDSAGRQDKITYSDTTPQVDYILDSLNRPVFAIQGTQITGTTLNVTEYTYRTDNLTLDTEITVEGAYDATATTTQYTSSQNFKRTLDRSVDGFLRPTGWTLNGTEHSAAYEYRTDDSRLNKVTGNGQSHTYGYESSAYGLVKTVTSPAHTVTNTYEADRNVLTKKENKNGATDLATVNYTVNDIGQRTASTHSGTSNNGATTRAFGYNATGEAVSTATDNTVFDRYFNYDGIGNRNESRLGTSTATGGIATNYTADAQNSYTAIGALNPIKDADGNMTSGPLPVAPTANATLAWDAENRLISVTVSGTTTTYGYDHQSRRIRKATGAAVTRFIYDGWNMIAEYAGSTLKRSYTWGMDLSGSMQGAGGVGGLLSITEASGNGSVKAGQTLYPTYDGNGNITRILDSSSNVVCSYGYDPFGNFENPTGNDADSSGYAAEQPFGFSTKYHDEETGLYYYGYRYYDPVTGRWPSRDPIEEEGGPNLYAFVLNNSVNLVDVLGLNVYGIDGTNMNALRHPSQRSNVLDFVQRAANAGETAYYQPGPASDDSSQLRLSDITGLFGPSMRSRIAGVKKQICKDWCKDKTIKINLVGWSRGAVAAQEVARRLATKGCCCDEGGKKVLYKPIPVNFLGLYDAVDRTAIVGLYNDNLTTNVENFNHAMRTGSPSETAFPIQRTGHENEVGYVHPNPNGGSAATTHGDIGTQGNHLTPRGPRGRVGDVPQPHADMVNAARNAGVSIDRRNLR